MTYFITIAGRRWPVEETIKTGKDVLGWDQCQARTWDATCRHTALSALAQLRGIAIRNAVCCLIGLLPATAAPARDSSAAAGDDTAISAADLRIPPATRWCPSTPASPARRGSA